MNLCDIVSITELSRLTGKSRPTLYKYLKDYEADRLDEIPYSFIGLIRLCDEKNTSRADIVAYCERFYRKDAPKSRSESELDLLLELIKKNSERLDLRQIREYIEREILK